MTLEQVLPDGLASGIPVLPQTWLLYLYMHLGWALVLAGLGTVLLARRSRSAQRFAALGLFCWALLGGPASPAYWLGLAFQSPSWTSVLLAGWFLQRALFAREVFVLPGLGDCPGWHGPVLAGIVLGYVLLLDTLALLPWQIYALGFSTAPLLLLLAAALLPWLLQGAGHQSRALLWGLPLILLLAALSRLPTGNMWDALLDPLLWLLLQALGLHCVYRRLRAAKPV